MNGCPACLATFRGTPECPRCGADLAPLMALAAHAWRLRRAAREALRAGDFPRARGLAGEAQRIHDTPAGRGILLAATGLAGDPLHPISSAPTPSATPA